METIKVISLMQPWAYLVVTGKKRTETRSWDTKFRGRIYIHASAKMGKAEKELCKTWPFSEYIKDINKLPLGKIIGYVDITETETTTSWINRTSIYEDGAAERYAEEYAFGDYSKDRYAWNLENPVEMKTPVPAKGMLGIWSYKGIPLTYKQRCEKQVEDWVKGNSIHNTIDDECCPDFSCCNPKSKVDEEIRKTFQAANDEQRQSLLFSFLSSALPVGVFLADGKNEIDSIQN